MTKLQCLNKNQKYKQLCFLQGQLVIYLNKSHAMFLVLKTLLFVFFLFVFCHARLYQLFIVSRHGSRYQWFKKIHKQPLLRELTPVGMRQSQKFGQILRQQYVERLSFLSSTYQPNQIEAFTTPINRSTQSMISQLYGLYPPGTGPKITSNSHKWHTPPYSNHSDIKQQNFALPCGYQAIRILVNKDVDVDDQCPISENNSLISFKKRSKQIQEEIMIPFKALIYKLSESYNFSTDNTTFHDFYKYYDVLTVDQYLGRQIPSALTKDDLQVLKNLASLYQLISVEGNNTKIRVSGKFKRLLKIFDTRINNINSQSVKLTTIAGHDIDILAIQLVFNLTSVGCLKSMLKKGLSYLQNCENNAVDFSSSIIFQLHSEDEINFYVKIRSNGKYMQLSQARSKNIDYQAFKERVKKFISQSTQDLCGNNPKNNGTIQQKKIRVALISASNTTYAQQ